MKTPRRGRIDTPLCCTRETVDDAGGDADVTQWVDAVRGGRRRGPVGIAQSWVGVLVRPRRFFREGVAPGDQGPGLTFLVAVVLVQQGARFALGLDPYPVLGGRPIASGALWLFAIAVLVAPVFLHLDAALQTALLAIGADERGGVSETVQVAAYAAAPMVLAGVPHPVVQAAAAAYAVGLYCLGLSVVHGVSVPRAAALGTVPAVLAYVYAFRTASAFGELLAAILAV